MNNLEAQRLLKSLDKNMSLFDQSRPNVGKIYRDTQMGYKGGAVVLGDLGNELKKGMIDDINEGLALDPYNGKPFYLTMCEKRDLQMPNSIYRSRTIKSYRPWPEAGTMVLWKNPRDDEVRFCWDLPRPEEMEIVLQNQFQYDNDQIAQIVAWKTFDMAFFGFYYHKKLKWIPNPKFKGDKRVEQKVSSASQEVFKKI